MEHSEVIQGGRVSDERLVGGGKQIKRVNRKAETSRDAIQMSPSRFELEPIRHPAYAFGQSGSSNRKFRLKSWWFRAFAAIFRITRGLLT